MREVEKNKNDRKIKKSLLHLCSHLGRVWLVRTRTGFTRTARLVGTAPVLGRPEHVLLAPASRPEQTEQFHFFTVKPGGNIDFGHFGPK